MKLDTLDGLGDDDLRAISARCEVLLQQHDSERKKRHWTRRVQHWRPLA